MKFRWWFLLVAVALSGPGCRKSHSGRFPVPPADTSGSRPGTPPPPEPAAVYSLDQVHKAIGSNVGGFYEALPPGYDTTDTDYPVLIFLHGGGELGDGNINLPLVLKNALPKMISKKQFPVSFSVKGKAYSFIVICPQFIKWPGPGDVKAVIEYALKNYRVDRQRVYLSGLSMGGGATWEYAGVYGRQYVAAIVPISGASWEDSAVARHIAASGMPVWAFHNLDDSVVPVSSTTRYVNIINSQHPAVPARMTLWEKGGHDAWTKACDPDYKEDNMNIYEWMLQYTLE